ncbi:50S ribosomal protein L29 [Candidatus Micrarchaeota archaeon]|nr:50S ribosomal protein L29 [Candidatus Micrarchaeota archaeon]
MAVYKISELRGLDESELKKKLDELNLALLEAGEENPKKNREIRKAIARIKTIRNEKKSV